MHPLIPLLHLPVLVRGGLRIAQAQGQQPLADLHGHLHGAAAVVQNPHGGAEEETAKGTSAPESHVF